jgi:hypothetical protein
VIDPHDCLFYAIEIQRDTAPRDWPRVIAQRVPLECREEVETYLRGIAARIRAKRAITQIDKRGNHEHG